MCQETAEQEMSHSCQEMAKLPRRPQRTRGEEGCPPFLTEGRVSEQLQTSVLTRGLDGLNAICQNPTGIFMFGEGREEFTQ